MKNTRENIIESAFLLFLQKSFKAVTIKEIVAKSEVSKGAFYHYFESKLQLFEEVCNHFYLDVFERNFERYDQRSLKGFCQDNLDVAREKFYEMRTVKGQKIQFDINNYRLVCEAVKLLPKFYEVMLFYYAYELESWLKVIVFAQKSGEITDAIPAESIAKHYIYMGDGFGMHSMIFREGKSDERVLEVIKKLYDDYYTLLKR